MWHPITRIGHAKFQGSAPRLNHCACARPRDLMRKIHILSRCNGTEDKRRALPHGDCGQC
jgi:hypothetical protein